MVQGGVWFGGGVSGPRETKSFPSNQTPPSPKPQKWVVRISLECFLVYIFVVKHYLPPRPWEQSNTCKNITYPQLRLQVVREKYIKLEAKYENVPSMTFFRALTHTRVAQ